MAIKSYKKGQSVRLSANFTSEEFDCNGTTCCKTTLIDGLLVTYLQKIRNHFNKSVVINSGYRCSTHNKKVNGSKNSLHTKGQAADIVIKGVKPEEVAQYAESIGILGIGLYSWGCHIDTRTKKFFWKTDKQIPVDTFGGKQDNTAEEIKAWQKAAIADGFKFASGANGVWSAECETVAKKAICKNRGKLYKYKNLTKIVQKEVGLTGSNVDGKFGAKTADKVAVWQKQHQLLPDGVVGYNTWKKMLGV